MPRKKRDIIKELLDLGFALDRVSGDHRIYVHPNIPGHVNIAGSLNDDAKHYDERELRRIKRILGVKE